MSREHITHYMHKQHDAFPVQFPNPLAQHHPLNARRNDDVYGFLLLTGIITRALAALENTMSCQKLGYHEM